MRARLLRRWASERRGAQGTFSFPTTGLSPAACGWQRRIVFCGVSVYFTLQKPYLQKYGALSFTAYAIWAGAILLLPFLPGLMQEVASAAPRATLTALYLGVSTVVAYATAAYVFSRLPASRAVTLEYVFPPVAIVIAYVWLRDSERLGDGGRGRRAVGGRAGQQPRELIYGPSENPFTRSSENFSFYEVG